MQDEDVGVNDKKLFEDVSGQICFKLNGGRVRIVRLNNRFPIKNL